MSSPPPAAQPSVQPSSSGRGPIANLPPELVVQTLHLILADYSTLLERQQASQKFLRVNRAFHTAYLLSEAVHECAITCTARANKLTRQLPASQQGVSSIHNIWIKLRDRWRGDDSLDLAIAGLVKACGPNVRKLEWDLTEACGCDVAQELVDSLRRCEQLQHIGLTSDKDHWRHAQANQIGSLLTALQHLTTLDIAQLFIDFGSHNSDHVAILSPRDWIVPKHLTWLSLHVDSLGTADLLAALVQASKHTIRHLTLDYAYSAVHDQLVDSLPSAFLPVSAVLTSFKFWVPGNGSAAWDFPAAILANLTHLDSIDVPLESVSLDQLRGVLQGRGPLPRLILRERPEAGFTRAVEWRRLVELAKLDEVKVGCVASSPGLWWELWKWLSPDDMAEEEANWDEFEPEMKRLKGMVEAAGTRVEWLEWTDWREEAAEEESDQSDKE